MQTRDNVIDIGAPLLLPPPIIPEEKEEEFNVIVIKDTVLQFPELYLEVFVEEEGENHALFAEMFMRGVCNKASKPEDADLVVFTGGPDVSPIIYGEEPHSTTHPDVERDKANIALYNKCYDLGIPMFGVCRGAQFLGAMNGTKLWQDIDGHVGPHTIYDYKNKTQINNVSSVHHQAVRADLEGDMEIIADALKSTRRYANPSMEELGAAADVEAFFYRGTCSLGVQGHPEYRHYYGYTKWCLELIDSYISCNPDLEIQEVRRWVDPTDGCTRVQKQRRMKRDLVLQRDKSVSKLLTTMIKEFN